MALAIPFAILGDPWGASGPTMRTVRILVWHGWLLEGSGSNVATARIVEVWRAAGHDVLLLCQERHPERYPWIDAHGTVDRDGLSDLEPNADASSASGRCVLLRPDIGTTLPVFVVDHYEGFETVRPFVDMTEGELDDYLRANVEALQAAAAFHGSDVAFVGHGIPGAAIGRRALGARRYVAKIHGSDLEYAIRPQERYRALAREGLEAAHAVVGPSAEVLARCAGLVPEMSELVRVVPPGVDVAAFRPRPRAETLREVAALLDEDPATVRGRPSSVDAEVERALDARDDEAIAALFDTYDEDVPEPDAAARLRVLAERDVPIVGYLGKLIPQKGVELLLEAQPGLRHDTAALVVGFGSDRDWLVALTIALRGGDRAALEWLRNVGGLPVDPSSAPGPTADRPDVTFTGLLDHRYAPGTLAAMDVQVVPSILQEAFGIVAIEGAAAGALPMVARHSGLAEIAGAFEAEVGRPGFFSFEPGEGAVRGLAQGIDRLLSLPDGEREELRRALGSFVATHWTWERTAVGLLAAAEPVG
jgi:glycosyltransferase involved in cell wall biosynthesis